jgi:hypothetical protein
MASEPNPKLDQKSLEQAFQGRPDIQSAIQLAAGMHLVLDQVFSSPEQTTDLDSNAGLHRALQPNLFAHLQPLPSI